MHKLSLFLVYGLFVVLGVSAYGQGPATSPTPVAGATDVGIKDRLAGGEVSAINTADSKMSLNTKDGQIDVIWSATTVFKKVLPENPNPATAVAATLGDIGVGDKILVSGVVAPDKKSVPAKTVYLMTKSDIAKKIQKEKEEWRTRGISGKVVSVNIAKLELTVATRTAAGEKNVIVSPKDPIVYKRYSADSFKYDDAKDGSFAEIKVGDQVSAIGDKSEDGLNFKAEKILSGGFKTVAGTVTAIDVAKGEITIKELQNNKTVLVTLRKDTVLKKFPQEMAAMMAGAMMRQGQPQPGGQPGTQMVVRAPQGGQPTGQPGGQPGQGQPNGPRPGGGPGGPGQGNSGMRMGGNGGFDDLLERLPNITANDLKVGDMIGVSCSSTNPADKVTALRLLSGVEPFIQIAQAQAMANAARGGGPPSLNIPGLDGIGGP